MTDQQKANAIDLAMSIKCEAGIVADLVDDKPHKAYGYAEELPSKAQRLAFMLMPTEDTGPPIDWPARHRTTEERARKDCAKGKHWIGLRADLTPHTACAWGWCDFGKEQR